MESRCSEGASRNLIGTDFTNESIIVVTANDKSYIFVLWVPSISTKSLYLGTQDSENRLDQSNVFKRPSLSKVISKILLLDLWKLPRSINLSYNHWNHQISISDVF